MSPELDRSIFHTPFAAASEKKPCRTYSHKGKNRRVGPLPPLRQNAQQSKQFRRHTGRSHLVIDSGRTGKDGIDGGGSSRHVDTEEGNEFEEAQVEFDAAGDYEEGTRMEYFEGEVSPARLRASYISDEYDKSEHSDEVDDSWSTPASSLDIEQQPLPARTTRLQKRSIRRRPFLIYNKLPSLPIGYKKLMKKPNADEMASPAKHRPGDGFSEDEARPDGRFHLARKRKLLPLGAPVVGTLDLTQSRQSPKKRKKAARRAEHYDNSFDVRRREKRHPKHNHQEKASAQEPRAQAAAKERQQSPIQTAPAETSAGEDIIVPGQREDGTNKGAAQVIEEGSAEEVPFSGSTAEYPSTTHDQFPSRTQKETTGSWETFISETAATCQPRIESTPPLLRPYQQTVDAAVQTTQRLRLLRRVKTV
ncbi:hypothetical protein B0T25DRAFT_197413 [Lasiosphaeria hispida]|uniref:Uncharacterized protein n=1 Tax=Lasiosphaeria hispida TaxID=260671 RepID=A0AAJ0HHS9_9PEZI|nr:hypothetical protein B0T25DRAFT_197413 [Lasiosphaeria hispida]